MKELLKQTLDTLLYQTDENTYSISFERITDILTSKKALLDAYLNPKANEKKAKTSSILNFVNKKVENDCLYPYLGEYWYTLLSWPIPKPVVVPFADEYPQYHIEKKTKSKKTKKKTKKSSKK